MTPFISVIIPVYNDAKRLRLCLEGLAKQMYPLDRFEIIVVDNGSSDAVKEVELPSNARLVQELKPGSYAARNKGVLESKGEVLAFTDSDCIPAPHWLIQGAKTLMSDPRVGIAGGDVKFFFKTTRPNIIELYDSLCLMQAKKYIEQAKFAVTANMFTYRKLFDQDRVGLFNSEVLSGGDAEWGKKAFSMGYQLKFASLAVVEHPARANLRSLYRKIRRIAGGIYPRTYKNLPNDLFWKMLLRSRISFLDRARNAAHPSKFVKRCLLLIEYSVQVVRIGETVRLRWGGKPKRT